MRPAAALFVMPDRTHVQRLLPLITGLEQAGIEAHVFTHRRFAPDVERAGGRFVDLFTDYPVEAADDESVPRSSRYVTHAAVFAERIARDVESLAPALVVYDTFAVIGPVVGRLLGIPYVNVCAGHSGDPARILAALQADPRVTVSQRCLRAVEVLRDRHGLADASPYLYFTGLSPFLNVYCEPPEFLTEAQRRAFEPVVFHGSLPSPQEIEARSRDGAPSPFGGETDLRVYASFGTIVWRYWTAEALAALGTIATVLEGMPGVRGLIGLGGTDPGPKAIRALTRPNVSVAGWVDQWRVLREADAFFTHQGLNSTHEAIFHLVPMVSYPFFHDQPALAETCQRLGLSVPLCEPARGAVSEEQVAAALARLTGGALSADLAEARRWELDVIAQRGSVVERIAGLIGGQG